MSHAQASPRVFTLAVGTLAVYLMATGIAMLARGTYPYRDRSADGTSNAVHLLRSLLGVLLLLIAFFVHIFTTGG